MDLIKFETIQTEIQQLNKEFAAAEGKAQRYKHYIALRRNLTSMIKLCRSLNVELAKSNPYKKNEDKAV